MSSAAKSLSRILRLKRVREKTGISEASIYNKLNPCSKYYDPSFPKQIRLGAASVGWLESEVDAWIAARAESRNAVV
ncbi:AlpA family transcriptional regulator [Trinickia sp. NRRL B-1857]|uniref:helix-turn-helix transcriptional regulator n=1 Tax=Trinickia sp. NRRL B-1857 TaxID=3162879 RepID=UPI003D26EB8A